MKNMVIYVYSKMLMIWRQLFLREACPQIEENPDEFELPKSLNIKKQWKGISLSKAYTCDVHKLIKDKACFEKEWASLGINSPLPDINFSKKMVIEIVKKNTSQELTFKDVNYKEIEGAKINKEILYDFYIDSTVESDTIAYLLLVTAKSDLFFFNEKRYYDGFYIAKGYFYPPTECG